MHPILRGACLAHNTYDKSDELFTKFLPVCIDKYDREWII